MMRGLLIKPPKNKEEFSILIGQLIPRGLHWQTCHIYRLKIYVCKCCGEAFCEETFLYFLEGIPALYNSLQIISSKTALRQWSHAFSTRRSAVLLYRWLCRAGLWLPKPVWSVFSNWFGRSTASTSLYKCLLFSYVIHLPYLSGVWSTKHWLSECNLRSKPVLLSFQTQESFSCLLLW